jgi:hypothetical protein
MPSIAGNMRRSIGEHMCRYGRVLAAFGYTVHDFSEVHNGTSLGPTDIDHWGECLFDLTGRSCVQYQECCVGCGIDIGTYQLNL